MPMIIGLTGSIASGKTTVSNMLREKGFPIVDADEIARLVVEPGSNVLVDIVALFGEEVRLEDGSLNRPVLGEKIFGNEQARLALNAIIHPAIRQEMLRQKAEWIEKGAKTIIMDIPLLFESQLQSFVDRIIVVSVTPEIQKKRLIKRNVLSDEQANARIKSQLPMVEKERGADAVIHNNTTLTDTSRRLEEILAAWHIDS
jgi:dephospho-CoA kinase